MAVQSVRLVGASTSGATKEIVILGTKTSATVGSGHAETKEATRAAKIAEVVKTVLTATAPIQ
tara:strand:+ start:1459 stop:1647 length:189 start_codon:yes stop_codon:yes gene_type:complete